MIAIRREEDAVFAVCGLRSRPSQGLARAGCGIGSVKPCWQVQFLLPLGLGMPGHRVGPVRTIMPMMRSCEASAAASSPTKRPSFIT